MFDQPESFVTSDGRTIGGVMMEMKNITLRFGGVVAIKDISFDIREGEIRAIIGPNGAGKSSMLNVISGFYSPQDGEVWYKGERRPSMKPFEVARQGIARTFQNIALFVLCHTRQCDDRAVEPHESRHFEPGFLVRNCSAGRNRKS